MLPFSTWYEWSRDGMNSPWYEQSKVRIVREPFARATCSSVCLSQPVLYRNGKSVIAASDLKLWLRTQPAIVGLLIKVKSTKMINGIVDFCKVFCSHYRRPSGEANNCFAR